LKGCIALSTLFPVCGYVKTDIIKRATPEQNTQGILEASSLPVDTLLINGRQLYFGAPGGATTNTTDENAKELWAYIQKNRSDLAELVRNAPKALKSKLGQSALAKISYLRDVVLDEEEIKAIEEASRCRFPKKKSTSSHSPLVPDEHDLTSQCPSTLVPSGHNRTSQGSSFYISTPVDPESSRLYPIMTLGGKLLRGKNKTA